MHTLSLSLSFSFSFSLFGKSSVLNTVILITIITIIIILITILILILRILTLCLAARKGETEAVQGYIAKGVDVNWKNPANWTGTALYAAAERGHERVVRELVAAGAEGVDRRQERATLPARHGAKKRHANRHFQVTLD